MKKCFAMVTISLLIGISAASAQEVPSTFTYRVGAFEVSLLSDGQRRGNSAILIGAASEMLEKYAPDGSFPMATNAFLVRTPDKNILVDAGTGARIFDNLYALGVDAGQIDAILITHMHGDHTGGLLRDGKAAFPKAGLCIPQPEYDYWMSDETMAGMPENRRGGFLSVREVVAAYGENLHLFQPGQLEGKHSPVLPGFQTIAAYGHTPGHTIYLVESGSDKLLIWGDLAHAMAVQMPCPQVAVTYDTDPGQAIAIREKVLRYVLENKLPVAGMHIPFPGMGTLSADPSGGYVFMPIR